ncbi:MAG TPA: hypothetical protein VH851_18700 [Candidatus Binatia bacterium]
MSWNSRLDRGGVVVGNMVEITIDGEVDRSAKCLNARPRPLPTLTV